MTFPTTEILDAFTRADGVLGSNWGIASGHWQFLIESNTVRGYPGPALMYWAAESFNSAQEVYTTIQSTTSAFIIPGVALCVNTPTTTPTGYSVTFSGTAWAVAKLDGTALGNGVLTGTAAVGCGIGATYESGTITVWFKNINGSNAWESQGTVADNSYNTGGYIGLYWSNGVAAETLGVVDATPNVTLPIGGSITTEDNTASGGDVAQFDINSAAERSSAVLGCAIGVGEFPGDYITHSLTPADNYTTWVNVADNVTAYETLSSTVSHVSFLDDARILTPGLYSDAAAGADFDARFFLRVDTANHGDIDTSSAAGQWLVHVFSGTNQTLTNLFDDFGGGEYTALTGVTVSGTTCGRVNTNFNATVAITPADATISSYAWSTDGLQSGQGTAAAVYKWTTPAKRIITCTVTDTRAITIAGTLEVIVSAATIREDIYNIVNGVSDTGEVYDYGRWAVLRPSFLSLFQTTVDGTEQVRGFFVEGGPFTEERVEFRGSGKSGILRTWNFFISGVLRWDDSAETEKTITTLVESVADALDDSDVLHANCLYYNADPVQLTNYEPRMFGDTLCHYVRLQQNVTEFLE